MVVRPVVHGFRRTRWPCCRRLIHGKSAGFFPGQGQERPGQLIEFQKKFPREAAEAVQALRQGLPGSQGEAVERFLLDETTEYANDTSIAQPANLVCAVAAYNTKKTVHDFFLGHSLGQISAFVAAGALSFKDGVTVVGARGRAMKAAVPNDGDDYGMVAGLIRAGGTDAKERIMNALARLRTSGAVQGVVEVANLNSPSQIVLSGHVKDCGRVLKAAKIVGVKLQVAIPFHSSLMVLVREPMAAVIANVHVGDAQVPVVRNDTSQLVIQADEVKKAILVGCWAPVDWVGNVERVAEAGVTAFTGYGHGVDVQAKLVSLIVNSRDNHSSCSVETCF
ncbi:acyl transferase/acyl hydrolase/lysophospholipase [Lipomyces japonicus]|uniref:acyl transferase/acyl hydrolase/lysophospholipase n=1 Tax=Lipomyces japonicus TaxID=56871 RepID=UPI0034CFA0A2